jgi:hypothetical protein
VDSGSDRGAPWRAREELLAVELRALLQQLDPVPAEVLAAARAAGPPWPADRP